ncbi:hypothetical protein [Cohnella laeviribosi]|uniref:hypothetical protein n=1 Tax=Cohnella laeviribosi TaxID=380174 RepID=UPI0003816105|nr:hypothetical protein [Cohnella laeviribosi]
MMKRKIGLKGMKWLKIIHLVLVVLMLGGIVSSVAIRLGVHPESYEETVLVYRVLQTVSDQIIRYGGFGILLIGLVYSIWTNWGFFKHKWILVKWIVFIAQTVFGIQFIDRWMVENLSLLETEKAAALSNPVFLHNETLIRYGAMTQTGLLLFLIAISVFKPWRKKSDSGVREKAARRSA